MSKTVFTTLETARLRLRHFMDADLAPFVAYGLRREGHFHQNVWFKGKWGDEYLYAMLQEEWRNMCH